MRDRARDKSHDEILTVQKLLSNYKLGKPECHQCNEKSTMFVLSLVNKSTAAVVTGLL